MKIAIDAETCQGHARCWEICPEFFSLDDEGHGQAPAGDVPHDLEGKVIEAVDNCPERAITLL